MKPAATGEPTVEPSPQSSTPTKMFLVHVVVARRILTATTPCPVQNVAISFDGRALEIAKSKPVVGTHFGPIPFVPGSHTLKITVACKGADRKPYGIDHNVRLLLQEWRHRTRTVARLDVGIEFDGSLDTVEFMPEDAGYTE